MLTLAAGLATAGCTASLADNPSERCSSDVECTAGRVCVRSFCVVEGTSQSDASSELDFGATDLGTASADLGTAVRNDLGVVTDLGVVATSDLGVVTRSDLGVVVADLGVDAGRDLGVDAGRDLGVVAADLGVDAGDAPSCGGRDTRCGLFCVDLDDNFLNCGACGRACSATDRRCHRGECDP